MAEPGDPPRVLRWAAVVLGVESLLALVAGIALGALTVTQTPSSYGLAVVGVLFALATAGALAKVAGALHRAEAWARGPATVTQLLLLPIGWTLAVTNSRPLFGVPLLGLAVATLGLLFSPAARSGLQER